MTSPQDPIMSAEQINPEDYKWTKWEAVKYEAMWMVFPIKEPYEEGSFFTHTQKQAEDLRDLLNGEGKDV